MKFNDIDLSTYGLIARRSPVLYMPGVGIENVQVGDKAYDFRAYLQPKVISVDVVVSSATLESDLDSLSKLLNPILGVKKLVLDKPDDRYYNAKVSGGFEYQFVGSKIAVGSIQFICPDPMAYDNDETSSDNNIDADPDTITEVTGGTGYIEPVFTLTAGTCEEQSSGNELYYLYSGSKTRVGQKLTISNRTVTSLTFRLFRLVAPTGDVTFTIRKVSNDDIIASKVWGDAGDLSPVPQDAEVTFDTPTLVNEEVRISCEFSGGDVDNCIVINFQNTDVKADEGLSYYDGSWTDEDGNGNDYDCRYSYQYAITLIKLENTDTEEEIQWEGSLANTEELEIDSATYMVKKEGVESMTISGQFPRLLPGFTNHIKVTGFDITGNLNIKYRDRYL